MRWSSLYIIVSLLFCSLYSNAQLLDQNVKSLSGQENQLKDNLDPSSHYIIACISIDQTASINLVNQMQYHQNYWIQRFNTEVIVLEDNHWNTTMEVSDLFVQNNWNLDCHLTENVFSSLSISTPQLFFVHAKNQSEAIPFGGPIDSYLMEQVDSIVYKPLLDQVFDQLVYSANCNTDFHPNNPSNTETFDQKLYTKYQALLLREDPQNGNIWRWNEEDNEEDLYLKYTAPLCSKVTLKDKDGDQMVVQIMDRYQQEGSLHLLTDHLIIHDCLLDSIPLELIQGLGTNAGLEFDIQNGNMKSLLVCQHEMDTTLYTLPQLENECFRPWDPNQKNLLIYPNPGRDMIYVDLPMQGEKKISLYSMDGKHVESFTTEETQITITRFSDPGSQVLFLHVKTDVGIFREKVAFH